jgi:signal transduction histidine kinase
MDIADYLQNEKTVLFGDRLGNDQRRQHPPFTRSLRSKVYIFIALVLAYMLSLSIFFFSQRDQPLQQLEQYQKIQKTDAALAQADLASFHVVTVLFAEVTRAELGQVVSYFSTLKQHYQNLRLLFPEQKEAFRQLEQSIPRASQQPDEAYLQKVHLHLARSKNELEKLKIANQLRMSRLLETYRQYDDDLVIQSLMLGVFGLAFISITTIAFFNRLKSDLLRLQVRAAEIENGYRGEPLAITRQDEVGQLTDGINYMAQALAQREQALEIERRKISFKERMTAMDSLAGGIAHEVGNPITCIAGLVDEICNDEENHMGEGSKDRLEQLQQYTDRIIMVTRDLSQLDLRDMEDSEWIDINHLLTNTVNLCRYDNRWSNINIRLDLDPEVPAIFSSENQISQMMMHLLENAWVAISTQNNPDVLLQTKLNPHNAINITVQDNGVGIKQEDLKKIFEPFYTTKTVGQGTGLGLAICWTIINSYHGNITAAPSPGGGTKIIIDLPCDTSMHAEGKVP